ncbi:hypothetical protein LOD99_8794 [Oopsacas minuta]|uniref:Uncharacterized protein n=1 Tax=Oopsacas minuta TaxID=111878 RepID=A0AAV7JFW3_9METZ|nr:hypothetical protein LOD99_8794 [Oopsacas minuta]
MMLCSQTEYDFTTTKFCKEIIAKGSFGPVCNKLTCDQSAFLMDSLEIGKKKYIDLRCLLLSDVQLPGYNRLATHRSQICLTNDIFSVDREHRVGIAVSYKKLLTHTVNRILTASANEIPSASNPKKMRISDGLDGSGSHRVHKQAAHPNISTNVLFYSGLSLIKDNLNIIIDIPSTQGGTTTTGNVVRRCLIRKDDNDQDFLYWVLTVTPSEFKPHRIEIHTCLGAILRIYNSSRRVDTEELALVCSNIYQSILCAFPWANVSPTLHKLLARVPEIISMFNDGHGLENISEEGLEASNKYIRRYRDRLVRKLLFEENLKDVFV